MVRFGAAAHPLFAELQNVDLHQPLLMEVKLIGCSPISAHPIVGRKTISGPGTAC